LTPSQRITYWTKNFLKLGFYPTVITREWTEHTKSHFDTKKPLGDKIRHEKFPEFEVYYLPFRPGILDRGYLKFGETIFRPIFLLIKLLDVFLAGFTLRFTSFRDMEIFAISLAGKNHFQNLLISGEPFYLFRIGSTLKKKFDLSWIADYRDDWNTNELQIAKKGGFVRKWISNIEANYERKWVGTAKAIISVSEPYTKRISDFTGKPGITIQNGFEDELLNLRTDELFDEFTLVYSGVLYPSQDIRLILGALEMANSQNKSFQLIFLGAGFDIKERLRIEGLVSDKIRHLVKITDRLPRKKALEILVKSHAFLGIAYGDMKGIPSSKLYEYMGLQKPVLLCVSDHDLMEEMLSDSGLGFFADSSQEALVRIDQIKKLYSEGSIKEFRNNSTPKIMRYTRIKQLQKIHSVLND
jgi:glycosyltransferase involved in cell wall biosynthesis